MIVNYGGRTAARVGASVPPVLVPVQADWSAESSILTPSAGQWDARFASSAPTSIIKVGGTYHLYYVGADGNRGDGGPAHRGVGLATSTDRVNWTKHASNPVVPWSGIQANNDDEEGAWAATAYIDGGDILLYVSELTGSGGSVDGAIVLWTSTDGINFTRDQEVLSAAVYGSSEKKVGAVHKAKDGRWSIYYVAKQGTVTDWSLHRAWGNSRTSFTNDVEVTANSLTDAANINTTSNAVVLQDDGTVKILFGIGEFSGGIDALSFTESDLSAETLEKHWAFATFSPALFLDRSESTWLLAYGDTTDDPAAINLRTATMELA